MAVVCALGLMSGTSMDGIDLALLETDGETVSAFGPNAFVPYDAAFRRRLEAGLEDAKQIEARTERPGALAALEEEITARHADAVKAFLAPAPDRWRSPALIGFHGQTVLHRPNVGLTVQLGDGGALVRATGIDVVYDMRANDMVHGGQGAPLVPVYHAALARSLPKSLASNLPVVFVNIGGISNITYVAADGDPIAFDTGPGNALIDQWVNRHGGVPYDAGGAIASEGSVVAAVADRYLDNAFFAKAGPKSLDRNDFTLSGVDGLELADGARTLASVSARAIFKAQEHFPEKPKLWIVCGGGRKNRVIMQDLRELGMWHGSEVILAEEAGLNGDFTEAEAWAFLAVRSRNGLPITYPTTTGCRSAVTGGILARAT